MSVVTRYSEKESFYIIETDKNVYYPGEYIECAVHLRLREPLFRAESLQVHIKGTESFKFTSKIKNQRSLKHKRNIIDQQHEVCRFMPSELDPMDYTFIFRYRIPSTDQNA